MADFDPLDPHIGCHPILPANTPIDQVRYSTILPVETLVNGVPTPAEIPTGMVMPSVFVNIKAKSDSHRELLKQAVSANSSIVQSWQQSVAGQMRAAQA